jgi:hypothetical protein
MKKYYGELWVSKVSHRKWKVEKDWVTPEVVVPRGFVSNGANIPRVLWVFMTPAGELFEASIVHDYMYDNAIKTKKDADRIFKETALYYGVPKFKAHIAYLAVKLFGRGNYE